MFPEFDPINNPIQHLTFYKEFEGARFPERGSEGAAGMDFFIPCPESLDDYAFEFIKSKCLEAINKESKDSDIDKDLIKQIEKSFDFKQIQPKAAFIYSLYAYNRYVFKNFELGYNVPVHGEPYIFLEPGDGINIPSGISADIPHGYAIDFRNKSGIATKKNLIVGAELVDEDYTGIMHLNIHNIGSTRQELTCGMKIAQAVIEKTYYDNITIENKDGKIEKKTDRGDGGFGSTGI